METFTEVNAPSLTEQERRERLLKEKIASLPKKPEYSRRQASEDTAFIAPSPLKVVDVMDFIHTPIPPRKMLLYPFLAEKTIGMIHAWRGVGKTRIGTGMAAALASGGKFLKWNAPEPSPVLYVDGEMSDEDIQIWLKEATSSEGIPHIESGMFNLISGDLQEKGIHSLSTTEGQHMVEDRIGDAKTVYFDNISCLFRGGDESKGEDWETTQEWLLSLRRRGVSSVLLHHDGKMDTQRGTSKREDPMNWVIQLKHPCDYQFEQGLRAEVHFRKARRLIGTDAAPFEVQLQIKDGVPVWTVKEMSDAVADSIVMMHVELGMSFAAIGKELDKSKTWAKNMYDKAISAKTVKASEDDDVPQVKQVKRLSQGPF